MRPRKYIRDVMAVLMSLGADEGVTIETGSKHLRIEIVGPLGTKTLFTSSSPSDHRTMLNLRSQVRRAARDIGLQPA